MIYVKQTKSHWKFLDFTRLIGNRDCLATDYLGPLPMTPRGNRYILLLTDHFSKYVEVIPVPNMTAEVCAARILNEYISRWGCPLAIHSDQGRTYESQIFKELCRMLEIRKTRTSVRNPKPKGLTGHYWEWSELISVTSKMNGICIWVVWQGHKARLHMRLPRWHQIYLPWEGR